MEYNSSSLHERRRASLIFLAIGLTGLLLLAGWFSVQADQGLQLPGYQTGAQRPPPTHLLSAEAHSMPATDTITSTAYLPLVAQTVVQTVTIMAPQSAWSAAWWQWIERVNREPIYHQGSVDCGLGQTGDVWFLAGTDGYRPTVRTCIVPPNKTFMVPLQTVAWANEGAENLTVSEKRAVLDAIYSDEQPGPLNTKICHLESSIDGEAVNNLRLQSPTFLYLGDPEAVADGFWFAFNLASGAHVVKFRGTLCDFNNNTPVNDIDVTYTLQVNAAEALLGVSWQLFVWNTEANPFATGCSPADAGGVTPCDAVSLGRHSIYAGTPPWSYVTPESGAVLTVVDTANGGDEFEIFDNNVSIGRTSSASNDAYCPVPVGGDPGVCLRQEGMSSGAFVLGPGTHSITIKPLKGFYTGVGYFRYAPTTGAADK